MSSSSWGEPARRSEEFAVEQLRGEEQDSGNAEDGAEEREKAGDGEQGRQEAELQQVGEDKQQNRRTETRRRGQNTQGMNEDHVTQADGAAPAICLVQNYQKRNKRSSTRHQKGAVQMHSPQRNRDGDKLPEEPRGPGPFFFSGGGNGASIVIPYCESLGWQRIHDKTREDYKLKWCELKSSRTYYSFRAGEQLVFQIPNNKILTTKIGLLNCLREYERVSSKIIHRPGFRRMKMDEFFPDTFRMDVKDEREAFFAQQEGLNAGKGNMWICKPTGLNQGRGIFLLQDLEDITALRDRMEKAGNLLNKKIPFRTPQAHIVQRYIQNPLLLRGKKFDVRSYFLIACTTPYMVFFRHGYVRLTCDLYDPNSNNLSAHLTNQYMQKKNPLYSILKEETVWSMERFNDYINEKFMEPKGLPIDWVLRVFAKRMQQIMMQCFLAAKAKLECKLGYFDLIGCDFLIDENFKVWLLEMNCNPALHTNCEVLKDVVPQTVTETLDLAFEIFNKSRCGLKLLPLSSQRDFVLLYCGESAGIPSTTQRSRTAGGPRPAHHKSRCTSKKTNKASTAANRDHVANQSTGTTFCSETMANYFGPSQLANSLSIEESFEPKPPSSNEESGIATSKTPTNITSHSTSSGITQSDTSAISCSQHLAEPQTKQISGKTVTIQKNLSAKPAETSQSRPRPSRASRVELRLNKCTWQQSGMTPDHRMLPGPARSKSTIVSLSSPALSEGSNLSQGLKTRSGQHGQSVYFRTDEIDLTQSLSCQPLCLEKQEMSMSTEKSPAVKTKSEHK
uniref:Tubulin tyrosine ligase like 10 n=1 Tax=Astyanax mexicanus TaxID=7994 RepID=A0A3B1K319_ASTMX